MNENNAVERVFAIAPMMDWDGQCRARLLDQTHHPWRAPGGTRWGASVLSYAYVESGFLEYRLGRQAYRPWAARAAVRKSRRGPDRQITIEKGANSSAGEMTK